MHQHFSETTAYQRLLYGGIAGAAAGIAKLLFLVAVIGFVIFIALGVFAGKKLTGR